MAVFQVVHKQRFLLQEIRNVFYYETITGNPSASEWQDICDEIRGDYAGSTLGRSNNWEFYGIDYRQVDVAGLPSFSVVPTAGIFVGPSGVDEVPTQICLLVSAKENVTKPNRVRTYIGGLVEDMILAGLFTASVRTAAETFFDLQSVLNAAGTNELQRVSAQWNLARTQVVAYNNVAGAAGVSSQVPATQRRRRIGVGI